MRTPHTCCRRGKRVSVVLRDGSRLLDRFVERTGKFVVLEEAGRVQAGLIRVFKIVR